MQSNEEWDADVQRRLGESERKRKKHRGRIVRLSVIVVSIVFIVEVSLAMLDIADSFQDDTLSSFSMAASVFHGGSSLGYIVIGLLAFVLGVCVTVLCYRMRLMENEEIEERIQWENEDD